MKKNLFSLALLPLVLCNAFSGELPVYQIVAEKMLFDENNPVRYNPVNIFNEDTNKVFAVSRSELDAGDSLVIRIFLAENTGMDSVTLRGGYFDPRYYAANDRIKTLRLFFINHGENSEETEEFTLADEMKPQTFSLGGRYQCSEIKIYVTDVYPGNRWDDIVMSGLSFSDNGAPLTPHIRTGGSCIRTCTGGIFYKYNDRNLVIEEYYEPERAGSFYRYFTYDERGRVAFKLYEGYDGGYRYHSVYYAPSGGDNPVYEEVCSSSGVYLETTSYEYSGDKLIRETTVNQENVVTRTIEYAYDDGNMISKHQRSSSHDYLQRFFYENNRIAAEYREYRSTWAGQEYFQQSVYVYFYENGRLLTDMCVFINLEEDARPAGVRYTYTGANLERQEATRHISLY